MLQNKYCQTTIATPLGPMIAIADQEYLYLLEFVERKNLEQEIARFKQKTNGTIIKSSNAITDFITKELDLYFAGKLQTFTTPIQLLGTEFQNKVWKQLQQIPLGCTYSYKQLAQNVGNPKGFRAVARANSTNQLAIIVPCHRVINTGGKLGGYAGGLNRKQWLLEHERVESKVCQKSITLIHQTSLNYVNTKPI